MDVSNVLRPGSISWTLPIPVPVPWFAMWEPIRPLCGCAILLWRCRCHVISSISSSKLLQAFVKERALLSLHKINCIISSVIFWVLLNVPTLSLLVTSIVGLIGHLCAGTKEVSCAYNWIMYGKSSNKCCAGTNVRPNERILQLNLYTFYYHVCFFFYIKS